MRLVDELGFDPDDGGGLDDSWPQSARLSMTLSNDAAAARRALTEAAPSASRNGAKPRTAMSALLVEPDAAV